MVFLKLLTETDKKPSFLSWYPKPERYLFYFGPKTVGASLYLEVRGWSPRFFNVRRIPLPTHSFFNAFRSLFVPPFSVWSLSFTRCVVSASTFHDLEKQSVSAKPSSRRLSFASLRCSMHHSYPLQQFSLWNLFYFHVYQKLIAHSRPLLILFQLCRFYFFYLPLFGKQQ